MIIMSFAIIQSSSRRTMWAKYPKNKSVRAVSNLKWRMKDSLLHTYVVVKTSNLVIHVVVMQRTANILAKIRAARAARLFMLF